MKKIAILAFLSLAVSTEALSAQLDVEINPGKTYQTIDNFAAADAWSGNFAGQYFAAPQKEQIAKWLFSQKLGADGNPEGIGLSMWRFNIGGGTLEQNGANIQPYQRRAESFLTKDGKNYDWGKCSGQIYFAKKAKQYGCGKLLLFSNTPPVQWTRNGQGYGEKGDNSANLKQDCYGKFADYMADVAKHFGEIGLTVNYISPINEPQVNWDSNRQEGSPWLCSEMKKLLVELDRALSERNLETMIYFGEAGHPKYNFTENAYGVPNKRWKKDPPDEHPNLIIKKFFDPKSKFYVGDLKHMPKFLCGHSYHSHCKNAEMQQVHKSIAAEAKKYGIGYHQSEWCMLPHFKAKDMDGFTPDWFSDNRADMQVALAMARIIYSDFTNANALSWGYWKAMEVNGDHALIGLYPKDGRLENGGTVRANKILWALGNYSLFVRPEYKRIDLKGADDLNKTAATAFASPDGNKIVAVFVNSSFECDTAKISLPEKYADSKVKAFRTDTNSDLANMRVCENTREFVIDPRSITTILFEL